MRNINSSIEEYRKKATHGDFFFAEVRVVTGEVRPSPVLVINMLRG